MRRDFVVYAGNNDVFAHFFECSMTAFDHVLALVSALPREEQHELEEILRKRRIEERREEIATDAREAVRAFHAGELKAQSVDEIVAELYEGLDEDDKS